MILLTLRSLLFTAFLFAIAIFGGIVVVLLFWAPFRLLWAITVGWCRLALWAAEIICGLEVVVEGSEYLPESPSVVLIKHTTVLETLLQVIVFPRTTWVVKRELLWIPFFGWAIALALQPIAINRRAGGRAVKHVIEQGKRKLAEGVWVTVFPEGTRVRPGETRRYGISGAALASEAGCAVVPVAQNAGDYWPRRGFYKRSGTVRFCIGPPIPSGDKSARAINALAQDWIESKMFEISSEYQKRAPREGQAPVHSK
jgi:1-acyl-sn-glycerol-3-phosphate acyltransferase